MDCTKKCTNSDLLNGDGEGNTNTAKELSHVLPNLNALVAISKDMMQAVKLWFNKIFHFVPGAAS